MRKIIFCLVLLTPSAALAASDYARVGLYGSSVTGPSRGRPTVPVTTTTTTNTYIPETDVTTESQTTYNIELDGRRNACLMTFGNVWADKMYASPNGVLASHGLGEAASPDDNVCYSVVSVKSADIKDMERFFPSRYFQTGTPITCGSWLDTATLEKAILDAKKGARIAGTIAASVGGAAVGVGLTELIGQNVEKDHKFTGQQKLEGQERMISQLKEMANNKDTRGVFLEYKAALAEVVRECEDYKTRHSAGSLKCAAPGTTTATASTDYDYYSKIYEAIKGIN